MTAVRAPKFAAGYLYEVGVICMTRDVLNN